MSLRKHAEYELEKSKLKDAYGGLIEKAVIELIEVFAKQGHSGNSAACVSKLFYDLSRYETLSPITDDPSEWKDVGEYQGGNPYWQNRRNSELFSEDGGKTYYDVHDKSNPQIVHKSHKAW